jgi:hypothetical protein
VGRPASPEVAACSRAYFETGTALSTAVELVPYLPRLGCVALVVVCWPALLNLKSVMRSRSCSVPRLSRVRRSCFCHHPKEP